MNIPSGIMDYKNPYKVRGKRILILSDIHAPYHFKQGLEIAVKHGKERQVDTVILNGDFLDMYQISRFDRSPEKRPVAEELRVGRDILSWLRKQFSNAEFIFVEGNHDERLSRYIDKHSELFGIPDIQLDSLLKLNDFDIKYINEKRFLQAGDLMICHGHELGLSTGGVNPARSALLKTFSNCFFGHFHKSSEYTVSKLNGDILACWSSGHLSDPHPKYMPVNMWNWGFGFVEVAGREFKVDNNKIFNGKVY